MQNFLIILVILFAGWSCSSQPGKELKPRNQATGNNYIMQNPCWGVNNLEKLFIKWNWVEIKDSHKHLKEPFILDIKIVRLGKMNEELFSMDFFKSKEAHIPTSKKYNLYSTFFTYEIFIKDLKPILLLDQNFFSNFEFDEYTLEEWEEKEELSKVYGLDSDKYKEALMISTHGKRKCLSSFFKKTPHHLKITLRDSNDQEVIHAFVPFNQIKRSPPYFNPSELYLMGQDFKSDLYSAVMNISVVLEQF